MLQFNLSTGKKCIRVICLAVLFVFHCKINLIFQNIFHTMQNSNIPKDANLRKDKAL